MSKSITITALSGGSGASTLCVEYSILAARHFGGVYVFDFSRKSSVDFIFKSIDAERALAANHADRDPGLPVRRKMGNIHSIPLGGIRNYECLADAAEFVRKEGAAGGGLWEKKPQGATLRVFDVPIESAVTRDAWNVSDLIVVPLRCDAHAYAQLLNLMEGVGKEYAGKLRFLINHYDSSRSLGSDVAVLMRDYLGERLCPVFIHEDENVREAIANKQSIRSYAPDSQAAHDMEASFRWVMDEAGRSLG
jgi:cellulose synthase operon protein YhjQ